MMFICFHPFVAESILEIFHILLAPQRSKELQEGQDRYVQNSYILL